MFWNKYPYTDFHELNLDMILSMMKELHHDWDEFRALNTITFSGAWDITTQYQAWTIVNVNDTTGYISVKPVPAGINYTNTDYWRLVVDYTATMADLQNRVVQLETDTAPVVAEYNLRTNRKMLFVGDSYSGTSHWSYKTGDLFGLTSGVSYFVNAVGGEGFTHGVDGNGFLDELVQFNADPDVPNNEITDIVVCGGANDALDNSVDIPQGISDFMTYAKAHFPNAVVYVGFIGAILNGGADIGTRTQNLLQKACFMYSSVVRFGGRYLAGLEFTMHKTPTYLDAGGLHPTSYAGDSIAKSVYNMINGFDAINEWVVEDVTGSALLGSDTAKTFVRRTNGETVSLACSTNTIDINPVESTDFSAGALGTAVYQFDKIYFNRVHIINGVSAAAVGVGEVYNVDIVFNEDKMYVRSNNHSGSNFMNITTTRLIVRNFTITVPAIDVM